MCWFVVGFRRPFCFDLIVGLFCGVGGVSMLEWVSCSFGDCLVCVFPVGWHNTVLAGWFGLPGFAVCFRVCGGFVGGF